MTHLRWRLVVRMQDVRAMVMVQNLASQLKSLCSSTGKEDRRAVSQISSCEVSCAELPRHTVRCGTTCPQLQCSRTVCIGHVKPGGVSWTSSLSFNCECRDKVENMKMLIMQL